MDRNNKNNPFRREGGGRVEKTKKEAEWGKVKFNPVAKAAIAEEATPWSHFKNEIIQKQRHDDHDSRGNVNNSNAKKFLKKREENHRRHLIESKRNQPTQWEDFNEKPAAPVSKSKKNKVPLKGQFQAIPSNIPNLESISKNEFDAKMLTPHQNNYLKKMITLHTVKRTGSLKQAVEDMQLHGVKRKQFKK